MILALVMIPHAICGLFGEFREVGKLEIKRLEQLFDPIVTFLFVSTVLGHERPSLADPFGEKEGEAALVAIVLGLGV